MRKTKQKSLTTALETKRVAGATITFVLLRKLQKVGY